MWSNNSYILHMKLFCTHLVKLTSGNINYSTDMKQCEIGELFEYIFNSGLRMMKFV